MIAVEAGRDQAAVGNGGQRVRCGRRISCPLALCLGGERVRVRGSFFCFQTWQSLSTARPPHPSLLLRRRGRGDCRRTARQQVPRELLDRELIKRLIAVEGVDHPVSVTPHEARPVGLVAVRVGIACGVEPDRGHPFPVAGRRQQPVDLFLKGIRRRVTDERIDLFRGR